MPKIPPHKRQRRQRQIIDDKFGAEVGITSPLLSIKEAIAFLKMSQSWLYVHFDEFEVVRIGSRIFVTRRSAEKFLASRATAA